MHRARMNHGFRWLGLLAGLMFAAWTLAQTIVITGAAAVVEVNGVVLVQIGSDPPRRIYAGNSVPPGAVLMTGPDATVVLAFADDQMVVLGERTRFRIASYSYERTNLSQSEVFLNLIEGSARLVMGRIGQHDPRLIRIQVGTGTLQGARNPGGTNAADAGVVVQGSTAIVTVNQGQLVLTLPNGQTLGLAAGQGAYVQQAGGVQQGSLAQILSWAGDTADGKQIVEQFDLIQTFTFPQGNQQTVITLATPGSPEATTSNAPAGAPDESTSTQLASTSPTAHAPTEPDPNAEPPPEAIDLQLATDTPITQSPASGGSGCSVASCS